jgi:tungstate transport system ATP-binding protein
MKYILQCRKVKHRYNGRTVLDIPELDIRPGSITGLAGPNGSGKSTLLKILSLTERCVSGTVYFEGSKAFSSAGQTRHRITMLPQETYLLKRSVFENIAYGMKIRKMQTGLAEAVMKALELVGLHTSFADRQWHELSGGEAQRVALAARLVLKPACLLLDEPTASVDMESAGSIRKAILLAQKEWGTTLIIASHHRSWLNDICDRITYLYKGRILDCSFENILPGPWEKDGEGYCTRLADGQSFHVSPPPHPGSCAIISPEMLNLSHREPVQGEKVLQGIMTTIFFDKLQAGPRIHVICGDHRFIASIDEHTFAMEGLRPGREVTIRYRPEDITWLPQ